MSISTTNIPAGLTGSKGSRKKFFGAGPLCGIINQIGKRLAFMPEFFAFYSEEVRTYITATPFGDFKSPVSDGIVGAGAFPSFVYFMTDRLAVSITFINIQYYSSRGGQSFTVNLNPQQWLLGVECYFNKKRPAATAR